MRFKQLKAVRMIRAGSTPDQVGKALCLQPDDIRDLEAAYRSVPDELLARFEQVLGDNEKLRRLVAGLGNQQSHARSGAGSK